MIQLLIPTETNFDLLIPFVVGNCSIAQQPETAFIYKGKRYDQLALKQIPAFLH